MVAPYDEAQESDGQNRSDHGTVSENGLPRIGRNYFGADAEGRQQYDVDLGVSKEPEKVLVQDGGSTGYVQCLTADEDVTQVERRTHGTVHEQEHHSRNQDREAQYTEDGRGEKGPDRQRQTQHLHALGPQVDHGHDVVETAKQRARHKQHHGDQPEGHACSGTRHRLRKGTEGWIYRPATRGSSSLHEQGKHHEEA